jgi:O-antigen/teichoic acid export membrane protein
MNPPARFGVRGVRLFSSAIMDQVVLSGTNFLVGLMLIRLTTDQDYGLYVLVQSGVLLAVSMQNAWLSGPLAILTPKMAAAERWHTIVSVMSSQRRWIRYAVAALIFVPLLAFAAGLVRGGLALAVATAIVVGWTALRREYLRNVLLMYSRPEALLKADAMYAATLIVGVVLAVAIGKQVVLGAIGALALASLAGAAAAGRSFSADPGWQAPGKVGIWPEITRLGFWALTGSTIYWVLGQSYSYVLASRLDLVAVANVNATRLLLMPAFVVTIGISALLTPTAATWYAQMGIHKLMSRLLMFVLAIGALELSYFLVVWFMRDWIIVNALHKHIEGADRLLMLWAGVALVAVFRDLLQCALIAMGKLQSLAGLVGVSALAAVLTMWFGITWWGAAAVLIGQIVGELINLAGIIHMLRKSMRQTAA